MTDHDHAHHKPQGFFRTPTGWIVTIALLALAAYLWVAHRSHVLAAIPVLILLLCPLMHIFMHRGHGRRHGQEQRRGPEGGGPEDRN